jgi:hypothetical protein
MKDLREKESNNKIRIINYRKIILIIVSILISLNIIFNPVRTAMVISNWINDFIGTMVKTINL